jgi:hypothetical protein
MGRPGRRPPCRPERRSMGRSTGRVRRPERRSMGRSTGRVWADQGVGHRAGQGADQWAGYAGQGADQWAGQRAGYAGMGADQWAPPCRPPARGGPTIRGGSTSPTTRSSIVGPPLVGGLWRLKLTPMGVALLYTKALMGLAEPCRAAVYSRATPCGWPAAPWLAHACAVACTVAHVLACTLAHVLACTVAHVLACALARVLASVICTQACTVACPFLRPGLRGADVAGLHGG